jgi:hypothetical protein
VKGDILKKTDFEANGDHLSEIGWGLEVFSAGTEVGEGEVAGTSKFEAGGYDGGIEVDDGAELDFEAKLHCAGRERFAAENPASAVSQRRGEVWEEAVALFVTEALDIER